MSENEKPTHSGFINHPSPYLAMHANDPVNWHLWSPKIFDLAKKKNKPILLSSGYFACHWCHVTQKEIYQDAEMALLMNRLFVNVKLDRELNPEQDRRMIEFAKQTVGRAGWPQHVILTPKGNPFAAFTYLPKNELKIYFQNVDKFWKNQQNFIEQLAEPPKKSPSQSNENWTLPALQKILFSELKKSIDDLSGGLNATQKFPNSPLLIALLKQPELPETLEEWLLLTLQQMHSQHLIDHVHGGFYRYTVDPAWQKPHFEKMLYDNAQLLNVYVLAANRWPEQPFLKIAEETLAYLRNHLYDSRLKLYLGSQSAIDAKGEEGGDYLIDKQTLNKTLTPEEFILLKQEWQLDQTPPYESGWHPIPTSKHWPSIRNKIRQIKPPQQIPTDTKAILSWNSLLLVALTEAAKIELDDSRYPYLSQAENFADQLSVQLQYWYDQQQIPRAVAWKPNRPESLGQATFEDFSYGLYALQQQQLTDADSTARIQRLKTELHTSFLTPNGWHFQLNTDPGAVAKWHFKDREVPSPTALLYCFEAPLSQWQAFKHKGDQLKHPIDYASYIAYTQCNVEKGLQY